MNLRGIKGLIYAASVLTVFTVGVSTGVQPATAATASGTTFGSVDVQKVLAGYSKKGALDAEVQDLTKHLDDAFKIQASSPMLSHDQQVQLGTLLQKTGPSDAELAQITALEASSKKDSDDLAALQTSKTLSDADKAKLDTLTKQQQLGQQTLQDIASSYRDQVQAQNEKLSGEMSDVIKATIADVAKKKGLDVVFDSQVAIYTANDITTDVLAKLNK